MEAEASGPGPRALGRMGVVSAAGRIVVRFAGRRALPPRITYATIRARARRREHEDLDQDGDGLLVPPPESQVQWMGIDEDARPRSRDAANVLNPYLALGSRLAVPVLVVLFIIAASRTAD